MKKFEILLNKTKEQINLKHFEPLTELTHAYSKHPTPKTETTDKYKRFLIYGESTQAGTKT